MEQHNTGAGRPERVARFRAVKDIPDRLGERVDQIQRTELERVAVIDFDVHHGNGTENILAAEPRAVFCSSFQHPLYPNSGVDPLGPSTWPVPVPAGTGGTAWREMVR